MAGKSLKRIDITRLIRPGVRKLTAYHVDESPVRIKLDAMENPFPLPVDVQTEIEQVVRKAPINLYPDPSAKNVKLAIADYWGMDPDCMILGNGSDELIQAIILAFGGPVLVPVPTFAMYEITSKALSQKVVTVPLRKNFSLNTDILIKKAKQAKARVIFLACPNNPTGNRFSNFDVLNVLDFARNVAVVIDEAYFSFSGKSFMPVLKDYPNMIILRTLSKIGLAGLRVGALTASRAIVNELNKIRLPYNINSLSQAVAVTALKHRDIIDTQISQLISEREKLYNELSQMPGVTAYPSETNFILIRTSSDASIIHKKLKQAGILVKNLSKPGPLTNCLRVTIGRPEENAEFLKTLKAILATE